MKHVAFGAKKNFYHSNNKKGNKRLGKTNWEVRQERWVGCGTLKVATNS